MRKILLSIFPLVMMLCLSASAHADVKIKQRMSMGGQKFESTRMIKGSRERTEQKIEMANRLATTGLTRIEVTSFMSPKAVPQMADAEQVIAAE